MQMSGPQAFLPGADPSEWAALAAAAREQRRLAQQQQQQPQPHQRPAVSPSRARPRQEPALPPPAAAPKARTASKPKPKLMRKVVDRNDPVIYSDDDDDIDDADLVSRVGRSIEDGVCGGSVADLQALFISIVLAVTIVLLMLYDIQKQIASTRSDGQ